MNQKIPLPSVEGKVETMPVPRHSEAEAFRHLLDRIIHDPSVDLDRVERAMAMYERIVERNARAAYYSDLARLQGELPAVAKKGEITISGRNKQAYAKLEDIIGTLRPVFARYGFSAQFKHSYPDDKHISITTIIGHQEGHNEETSVLLPLDTTGSKSPTQAVGSTLSYGRRYGLLSLLNVAAADDDDDASAANGARVSEEQVAELQRLIVETGANIELYLKHIKAESLSDIPAANFDYAKSELMRKKK